MLRLYVTPEYRTCSCQVSAEVNLSDDLSDDQNAAMHSYHMHARNLILHAGSKTAGTCLQPYSYSQLEGGGGGDGGGSVPCPGLLNARQHLLNSCEHSQPCCTRPYVDVMVGISWFDGSAYVVSCLGQS